MSFCVCVMRNYSFRFVLFKAIILIGCLCCVYWFYFLSWCSSAGAVIATVVCADVLKTNVGNNNNKFYLIQLLEDDNRKQFCVWFRWGRVGFKGQSTMTRCGPDLDQASFSFSLFDSTQTTYERQRQT